MGNQRLSSLDKLDFPRIFGYLQAINWLVIYQLFNQNFLAKRNFYCKSVIYKGAIKIFLAILRPVIFSNLSSHPI
jgi:hypothetical protein